MEEVSEKTIQPPLCEAMLFCDLAIRSNKGILSLINVVDRILSPEFPAIHSKICLFIKLAHVAEGDRLQIFITPPQGSRDALLDMPVPPLIKGGGTYEINFAIEPLGLSSVGDYIFTVSVNGVDIASRTLVAQLMSEEGTQTDAHA